MSVLNLYLCACGGRVSSMDKSRVDSASILFFFFTFTLAKFGQRITLRRARDLGKIPVYEMIGSQDDTREAIETM